MHRSLSKKFLLLVQVAIISLSIQTVRSEDAPVKASKFVLKKGARVAVIGDSITEQKQYSRFIEDYLTVCVPELELKVMQFGWGGETAPGFQSRMDNDLMPWHPDVATTCYGMNDGGYRAFEEGIGKRYQDAIAEIVKRLKASGAVVVVGSPGAVDTKYFRGGKGADVYNDNLGHLRDLAQAVANANEFNFANVHDPMVSAMKAAKAAYGDAYDVCGTDGVHPGPNGHLIMAYAYLKAMGLDGNIGTITMDMKGKTTATDGHKVLSGDGGKAEIESSRYPFCFFGDEKSSKGNHSILPYVPFNQDLNRFMLVVKNLDGAKGKVTWGTLSKSFSKEELEKGINLADQFPVNNPFWNQFSAVDRVIGAKQSCETPIIKECIHGLPGFIAPMSKEAGEKASADIHAKYFAADEELGTLVRANVIPVKHTIVVEVEK